MAQEYKQRQPAKRSTEDEVQESPQTTSEESADEFDVDDLLDEIDEVLEVNAEVFVREYVQRGGQ